MKEKEVEVDSVVFLRHNTAEEFTWNVKYQFWKKISLWTCQASDAQSPDSFEGAAEATIDSAPTPCASLSAPSLGLTALCRLPTMVCTSSELSFASVTTCTWNIFHSEFNLMGRGHLAAMIRSSRRLPFFSQLESATSWSRDSPLPDGTHLDASWI